MELPLCKLCGDRHRLGFCPQFGDAGAERRAWLNGMTNPVRRPAPVRAAAEVQPTPSRSPASQEAKPKFDKRAYQRDLMRKRRKEGK